MSNVKKYKVAEPYLRSACAIGESIHYDDKTKTLSFLDCGKQKLSLHRVNIADGPSSHEVVANLELNQHKVVDIAHNDGLWLCGAKYGFGLMDKKTGKSKYIKYFWTDEEMAEGKGQNICSNDGGVDSHGRFWIGTMNDPFDYTKNDGSLWRLDPDLSIHCIIKGGIAIPNGISWSPDDKTMYFTDSNRQTIFAFDFDAASGNISNQRTFFSSKATSAESNLRGSPDGHAMDEEGHLWVALFGGWKVVRVSPQGTIVAEVSLPTRCITDVVFAGEDIFITTAADWAPEKYPESVPMQGHLFRCHVGVKALPQSRFTVSKDSIAQDYAKL